MLVGGTIGVSRLRKMSRGIMTEIEISVVANFKLPNLIFLVVSFSDGLSDPLNSVKSTEFSGSLK